MNSREGRKPFNNRGLARCSLKAQTPYLPQGASVASGMGPAELFSESNKKGVVFVKEWDACRKILHEQILDLAVGRIPRNQAVPSQDSASVGIHHENRFLESIEQNGVGCLRTNAGKTQKFFPESIQRPASHAAEISAIVLLEVRHKNLQPPGLLVEIAAGPDESAQTPHRNCGEPIRRQRPCLFKIGDGGRGIGPIGILGEDGADGNFERRLPGPPMLGTEMAKQFFVDGLENRTSFKRELSAKGCKARSGPGQWTCTSPSPGAC